MAPGEPLPSRSSSKALALLVAGLPLVAGCTGLSKPGTLHIDDLEYGALEEGGYWARFTVYNLGDAPLEGIVATLDYTWFPPRNGTDGPAGDRVVTRLRGPELLSAGGAATFEGNVTRPPHAVGPARLSIYAHSNWGRSVDTVFTTACDAPVDEARAWMCRGPIYHMGDINEEDPLPGSPYWRERINESQARAAAREGNESR